MSEINLLQNQNYELEAKQTYTILNRVGIGLLVFMLLAYGAFYFIDQNIAAQAAQDLARKQQLQLTIQNDPNYAPLLSSQAKLKNLQLLLDKHLSWGDLLQKFGDAALKTATYSRFAANSEGGATITGVVPDFQNLDKLMKAYQLNDFQYIKDVKLVNVGLSKDEKSTGINFTIKVTFNKSLLLGQMPPPAQVPSSPALTVPAQGTGAPAPAATMPSAAPAATPAQPGAAQ